MQHSAPSPASCKLKSRQVLANSGFTLVEVIIACGIIVISFGALMQVLLQLNRQALLSRVQTNARMVVQRNIDQALAEKFTLTVTPPILAITSASGVTWDDDGGGDNRVSITVENGTTTATTLGTLTRTVTAVANANGADIRLVRFSIAYNYRGRPYTFSATTMRSRD
jgi:type II secretory pathway pseudopilin PulG